MRHQARENVVGAAGWKADYQMYRMVRIGLRLCGSRKSSEAGANSCQAQKSAAGNVHMRWSFFDAFS
jgi:hypothetical protein